MKYYLIHVEGGVEATLFGPWDNATDRATWHERHAGTDESPAAEPLYGEGALAEYDDYAEDTWVWLQSEAPVVVS